MRYTEERPKKAIKILTASKKRKVREILSRDETFQMLKLSNTLSLIEIEVKETRYTEEKLRKKLYKY